MEDSRLDRIEKRVDELEKNFNIAIPEIQSGIKEIKVMLEERPKQEELKNAILAKDISAHDSRIKKLEDNQTWLWRTVAGGIITMIIGVVVSVIKIIK